ncbi:HAD-IIA family hydrolase [Corynebacterium tapiri]|uniref:HAD-IIA family hydrolase n=1 Tax=Corynebacterium tapiri TaxID=1448266 RepID=A0A5C4U3J1_9CORY|nr:HAD-IIA family hydrolase [Corynebacterium tapiri]TNL97664.1 HAD-IIA family hydrolase [Corynebacterium tapiri]
MTLLEQHDALLLDLDGTVWESGQLIDGALDVLGSTDTTLMYVTNNASRSPETVAEMLSNVGLATSASAVLNSAQAAVNLARNVVAKGSRVLVLGTEAFSAAAQTAGFEVVGSAEEDPAVVLHGHNPATGWAELSEAALAIQAGARYIASNVDTTLPTPRGLCVGNGSMVAAVTSATGVTPQSAGKPEPAMFVQAASSCQARRPLAVGDRLDTDIKGAVAAGMSSLHVLTGVSQHHALVKAPVEQRPTYVAEDLRGLLQPAEALLPGAQGGFSARRVGEDIVLDGGTNASTATHALRTVLAVAWNSPQPPRGVQAGSPHAERVMEQWL